MRVKRAMALALGNGGSLHSPCIRQSLNDEDRHVVAAALESIERINSARPRVNTSKQNWVDLSPEHNPRQQALIASTAATGTSHTEDSLANISPDDQKIIGILLKKVADKDNDPTVSANAMAALKQYERIYSIYLLKSPSP